MANDFADAFLQTYMAANQQRQANQQFAWQNLWTQQKLAQEKMLDQQRIDSENAYRTGMLGDTRARLAVDQAKDVLAAQKGGAVVAQPQTAPAALMDAQQPPAAPDAGSLPVSPGVNPMARNGVALPPAGAVQIGQTMLRQQSPQELAQQSQLLEDQASQHKAAQARASLDQMKQAGIISPGQHQQLSALYGAQTAIGRPLNEAEASIISPKPGAVHEGDTPLGAQADSMNKLTLKRLQVLDPTIKAVPPELMATPATTRDQFSLLDKNMAAIENAKGTQAQRDEANALRAQMNSVAQSREDDRKAQEAEKYVGASRDAAEFSRDYMSTGHFTGAGDEQLQERFFDAIKPATGFRMTKQMLDLQQKLQSVESRAKATWANLTGGTLYSPQLRQEVADQIESANKMKASGLTQKGKAAPPVVPATHAPVTHRFNPATGKIEAVGAQ